MRKLGILISFLIMLFLSNVSYVEAKEVLVSADAKNNAGKIEILDDISVRITYANRVKNVSYKACLVDQIDTCEYISVDIVNNDSKVAEFGPILLPPSNKGEYEYKVIVMAKFDIGSYWSTIDTSCSVKYVIKDNGKYDVSVNNTFYTKPVNTFKNIVNKFIIPGLYAGLGITLIVKAILLAIDIVKIDSISERKEKIKAFSFFFIGIVAASIVTTFAGYISGLFSNIK